MEPIFFNRALDASIRDQSEMSPHSIGKPSQTECKDNPQPDKSLIDSNFNELKANFSENDEKNILEALQQELCGVLNEVFSSDQSSGDIAEAMKGYIGNILGKFEESKSEDSLSQNNKPDRTDSNNHTEKDFLKQIFERIYISNKDLISSEELVQNHNKNDFGKSLKSLDEEIKKAVKDLSKSLEPETLKNYVDNWKDLMVKNNPEISDNPPLPETPECDPNPLPE